MERIYTETSAFINLLVRTRYQDNIRLNKNQSSIKKILFISLFSLAVLVGNLFLTNSAIAAIVQRGTATQNTVSGNNAILTISKPTGLTIGDVMIVQIVQSGNGNNALTDATGAGWTEIAGSNIRSANNNRCRATLLYKVVNSTDVAASDFSFPLDATADNGEGAILAYSGVDPVNIFDVTPGTAYTNINLDRQLNASAIITATANSAVIMFGALYDNQNLSNWSIATTPTATALTELYDLPYDAQLDIGMGAASVIKATAGSTGVGTATIAGTNDRYNGSILIALKPNFKPTITSFTPTNACYGSLASVVITGANFTGVTAVTFNGVPAAHTVTSATEITATLPATATTGTISITNAFGTGTSANSFIVNALPTVTANATPAEICSGSNVNLTTSANPTTFTILSENFNNATNNWTTINNSTGGTPANATWTLRPNGYQYTINYQTPQTVTFNSNDASQFYLSNSDDQGGGTTATILQSPVMSTIGYSSLSLDFFHHYDYFNVDYPSVANVEVSTNGATWNNLASYTTTDIGAPNSFVHTTIDLTSYVGNSTFYIRFYYNAAWAIFWAIDNVTVSGTRTYNYSWSATPSATAGLPAGAGTPSLGNGSIVANPTQNTSYIATAVNTASGCSASSAGIAVTVFPSILLWSGETSSDWHLATNWEPKSVPTACADVLIPANVTNFPTISSAAICDYITIESGASLLGNENLTISKTATFKRSISLTTQAWHFLSSPTVNQLIWDEFAPLPTNWGVEPWNWDFYYWNPKISTAAPNLPWVNLRTSAGLYNSGLPDATGNFGADAGFGTATPPSFTKGRGYLVSYGTDYGKNLFSFTSDISPKLNNASSPVVIPVDASANKYNLIGNPFPSAIDWESTTGWTRDVLTTYNNEDFWIYSEANGGYGAYSSLSNTGINGVSQYIAPAQAFFVKANTTGNITMAVGVRCHNPQPWLKNTDAETTYLRLKITTTANSYSDEMIVDINEVYIGTEGTDKLWGFYAEAPEIYSVKGGNNYSIDRYKDLNTNLTVDIGTKTGVAADYAITATNIQEFNLSSKVLLEDLKTGIVTDLKQTPAYTFAGAPGDDANRFRLIIGSPIGIDEPNTTGSFNIYTYENMVYVQNDKINEPYFVTVSNMLGQTLVRTDFTGNSLNRIEMQNVPGVYVVNVVSNGKTYSQKVVIR